MRLQFLVHLPHETDHNITVWAEKRDHTVARTQVFKGDEFPWLDDFDWLMIMGGFQSAWEEETYPWLTGEKRFILQALNHDKIVLGICFGAQLLAEVLGGRAFSNKHQEIGWHEVSLTPQGKKSFLFKKAPDPFRTFLWHSDHFSLPSGCASLAFSEASPHQAFISRTYPAIGLQFHPEMTLGTIRSAAERFGGDWVQGPYVAGKEAILAQTDHMPDTYWLMATLLDNMEKEFGGPNRTPAKVEITTAICNNELS